MLILKMAFELLPMNLTALENISPPNISLSGSDIFSNIVAEANFITNDYLILASMVIILTVMYLSLSDKGPFQDFGYDDMRALNISLASCTLIGLTIVEVGWSGNFVSVGMFGTLWLLTYIGILVYENKE